MSQDYLVKVVNRMEEAYSRPNSRPTRRAVVSFHSSSGKVFMFDVNTNVALDLRMTLTVTLKYAQYGTAVPSAISPGYLIRPNTIGDVEFRWRKERAHCET